MTTIVERDGHRVAALVHDASLCDDPELVEAVCAAAGLVLENERLQAELRAQLDGLRASRARIIEAVDTERRRVERDLHDGTQQRLVSASMSLGLAGSKLSSDGVGGADPAHGSGLRGLADRVEALGGRFTVESPPGKGTRLRAEIPCASNGGGCGPVDGCLCWMDGGAGGWGCREDAAAGS